MEGQFSSLSTFLPAEVYQLLSQQMREVASGSGQTLGVGLAGAILLSVWSATRGTRSLISALITILGAELNAEIERQTSRDSTRGEQRPRGERGAYVADHLPGEHPSSA